MLRLTRPSGARLRELAAEGTTQSLTYESAGMSALATPPDGYRRDQWDVSLGRGDVVFGRAAEAIRLWKVHTGAGLVVEATGPPAEGLVVAMGAPLPVGWVEVVCRVVDVFDEPDRVGFAYGTLPVHPEQGEESFTVVRRGDEVAFRIVAVWRSRHLLARAAPPVARHLQRVATDRYLDAMRTVAGG